MDDKDLDSGAFQTAGLLQERQKLQADLDAARADNAALRAALMQAREMLETAEVLYPEKFWEVIAAIDAALKENE